MLSSIYTVDSSTRALKREEKHYTALIKLMKYHIHGVSFIVHESHGPVNHPELYFNPVRHN